MTAQQKLYWDSDPVKGDPLGRVRYRIVATGKTITQSYYSSSDPEAEGEIRRLVACWNACDGQSIESIEELAQIGGVPGLIVHASNLRGERDDLLAALQNFVKEFEGCYADGEPAMIAARAAIQKATNKEQA